MSELYVDCFAGGGGASTGIEAAIGRPVDIAINHSPDAIALHKVNHPKTRHYCENILEVDPVEVCQGRRVALVWLSPDCKHFSKAKGGKPRDRKVRSLAWVGVRWAREVQPRVIILENVEEFQTWGPLLDNGKPDKTRTGETFQKFVRTLEQLSYKVQWRELRACDYGVPTMRKRLFLIARRDGLPIVWPKPSHGKLDSNAVKSGERLPWKQASEIIDWTIPGKSIFNRAKPLAEGTLKRIARGIDKFIINNPEPYIVPKEDMSIILTAVRRVNELSRMTTTDDNQFLVTSFLAKHYGGNYRGAGSSLHEPLGTITTVDHHALISVFLIKFYGDAVGQSLESPLHTVTTKDRFGLIMVQGKQYKIVDIHMRMLSPRELARATGFQDDYILEYDDAGKSIPKYKQVYAIGNAVCPPLAEALVRANLG